MICLIFVTAKNLCGAISYDQINYKKIIHVAQVDRPLLPSDGNERHLDLVHAPLCSFRLPLVVSVEIKLLLVCTSMVFMSFFKACRDCCHRQLHSRLCLGRRTLHRWIAKRYINMKENEKLRK